MTLGRTLPNGKAVIDSSFKGQLTRSLTSWSTSHQQPFSSRNRIPVSHPNFGTGLAASLEPSQGERQRRPCAQKDVSKPLHDLRLHDAAWTQDVSSCESGWNFVGVIGVRHDAIFCFSLDRGSKSRCYGSSKPLDGRELCLLVAADRMMLLMMHGSQKRGKGFSDWVLSRTPAASQQRRFKLANRGWLSWWHFGDLPR